MASTLHTTRDVSKSCEEIAKVARSLFSEVRLLDSTASETESVVEWRSHTVPCTTRFKGHMRRPPQSGMKEFSQHQHQGHTQENKQRHSHIGLAIHFGD